MIEQKNTTTGAPVDEQAPIPGTEAKAPASVAAVSPSTTVTGQAIQNALTQSTLPKGYLSNGYYKGAGKERYTDPALFDQAEEIGKIFAAGGLTTTAFNRIQRTLKSAAKLPAAAQTGAFKKVLTQVTDLENRKKAPPLLRKVVERNQAAVQTEGDYAACLDHFRDIAVYLSAQSAAAGTPS